MSQHLNTPALKNCKNMRPKSEYRFVVAPAVLVVSHWACPTSLSGS